MWVRMASREGFMSPLRCKAAERMPTGRHAGRQVMEALQGSEDRVETSKSALTERRQQG